VLVLLAKEGEAVTESSLSGAGDFDHIGGGAMMPDQDERIARLKTPKDCEQFAINVEARGKPELALAARRRGIELEASARNASTPVEHEALQAVLAYERALSKGAGKKIKAARTWQMIERRGIIPAVEHIVSQRKDAKGYTVLVQMGMEDMAFEAVVLRHPEAFSEEAIEQSKTRLGELRKLLGETAG
jgi:hypothetical protein